MKPLQIHYPFKPFKISQSWGNLNPAYNSLGFKRHNGIDAVTGYVDQHSVWSPKTWLAACPVEDFKVQLIRNNPSGGGNEVWLLSKNKLQIGDKQCFAYLVMCHAEKILVPVGYEPKLGEFIMVADNTGFSTGPHTHLGLYRVDYDGVRFTYLDTNDANGSHDPALYFTGKFAIELATKDTLFSSFLRYLRYLLTR